MAIPTIPFITYNPTSMSIYGYIGGMAVALVAGYFLITIILDFIIIIKYMGFSYNIGFLIWYVLIILSGLLAGLRRKMGLHVQDI